MTAATPPDPDTSWVLAEFRARGVVHSGHFALSSGRHSDTYLQCALALQDPAFAQRIGGALAARAADSRGFDTVASPALGGVLAGFVVAAATGSRFVFTERQDGRMRLRRGQRVTTGERILLVEDVLTTGGSAQEAEAVLTADGANVAAFAAIVDRSTPAHPLPFAATSLLRLDPQTWDAGACPLCARGEALDQPGSRGG